MRILVTAGPTREMIDPVRFISNRSSGKMGHAIANAAADMGHDVILVAGPTSLPRPDKPGVCTIDVVSAADMADAVIDAFADSDAAVMAAAVADYRPVRMAPSKIKKGSEVMFIELVKTVDILQELGRVKLASQILVGFAAETDDLLENARSKLIRKNLDWIAANDVSETASGFDSEFNRITLLSKDGRTFELPLQDKKTLARLMLDIVLC